MIKELKVTEIQVPSLVTDLNGKKDTDLRFEHQTVLRIHLKCRRPRFHPWFRKIPLRREWLHTPIFLPGESHGQRDLVGYSVRGHKESDMTERLTMSTLL